MVPSLRVRAVNDREPRPRGSYVLYWMTAARRAAANYALDRAIEYARAFARPIVVLEALRCDYPHASARFHRFVIDGMADDAKAFGAAGISYHPYVEPRPGAGKGLLAALASRACVVVTDDFPAGFHPRMTAAAGKRIAVRLEAVDSNGTLPLRAAGRAFSTAHALRRFLQRALPEHLASPPRANPLARLAIPAGRALPRTILRRWPRASHALLRGDPKALAALPIDARVAPGSDRGGRVAGLAALRRFVRDRLPRYAEDRNHPDAEGASGLSPWLHLGHVSAHDVVHAVLRHERVRVADLLPGGDGSREGWWGASPSAEAFLDQVVTWRELGLNACAEMPDDYDRTSSLPEWARRTLSIHARDERPIRYGIRDLESARTHDPVWNAAQRELTTTGRLHNHLRMLWGKKILEWSATPEQALATMVHLNDRHALDGRDPNSYEGILWVLGRHDRAWGPERPIFGTVRYMSSDAARRKLRLRGYLDRFGDPARR